MNLEDLIAEFYMRVFGCVTVSEGVGIGTSLRIRLPNDYTVRTGITDTHRLARHVYGEKFPLYGG